MIKEFQTRGIETAGEYTNNLFVFIMQDDEYPIYGYKPIDIKDRIEKLLRDEESLKKYKESI